MGADLHMLFETLAYVLGYQLYRRLRRSFGDPLSQDHRWWIIATAAVGAVLGSKILGCMEQAPEIVHQWRNPAYLVSGKSIVGGLVGGWMAVEWIKHRLRKPRKKAAEPPNGDSECQRNGEENACRDGDDEAMFHPTRNNLAT